MTALVQSSVTAGAPTRPAAERALRSLVSDPVHLAGRGVRALLRQPWFVAITLVQPVVWLLLFGALFENVVPAPNGFKPDAQQILVERIRTLLGGSMHIEVTRTDHIERERSGKMRVIVGLPQSS